jgi:hypothetical protein
MVSCAFFHRFLSVLCRPLHSTTYHLPSFLVDRPAGPDGRLIARAVAVDTESKVINSILQTGRQWRYNEVCETGDRPLFFCFYERERESARAIERQTERQAYRESVERESVDRERVCVEPLRGVRRVLLF